MNYKLNCSRDYQEGLQYALLCYKKTERLIVEAPRLYRLEKLSGSNS
jgi:hypothetical protein